MSVALITTKTEIKPRRISMTMASYTTFLDTLNLRMRTTDKLKYYKCQFKELHTDEERIILSLKVLLEHNQIPASCGNKKDAKESEKLRKQGNEVFISRRLTSYTCAYALKLYTKSIAYAPCSSEYLALGYANRSAVFLKLHKYEECIQDIDRALAFMCTGNIRIKLHLRKVECLIDGKHPNVENSIKEVECLLENMDLDDAFRRRINEKLGSIKAEVKPGIIMKHNVINQLLVPEIKTRNAEVPCASDAVAIKYNDKYGRHVAATRNISVGEIITMEPKYFKLLSPDNVYTHCSYCDNVSWANIPCNYCTCAMYCSEECKTLDWEKYHDIECAVFPTMLELDFSKLDLLSLRIAIQAVREVASVQELKHELNEVDSCDDPRTKGFSKDGIFASDKYRSVIGLLANTEKRSEEDLFRRAIDSCFILYLVATRTSMFGVQLKELADLIENPDVTFFGSLILRHQQQIPSNAHSDTEVRGTQIEERCIVLLPFHSLFNHSCNPNIARYSKSGYIIAFAKYPIEKGAQLFCNYGQVYAITPKHSRRKELLRQYYFTCNCIACEEDWPIYFSLKPFQELVRDATQQLKILYALRQHDRYVGMVETGNITDKNILKDLIQVIEIIYKSVRVPCLELINVIETFMHAMSLTGDQLRFPELQE